jgi:hypothetical protein
VLHDIAAQVVTDLVGIPTSLVEQPLHPVWGVLTGVLGQLPTVLVFYAGQQAAQERSCPTADLDPAEPRRDPPAQRLQLHRPALDLGQAHIHASTSLAPPAGSEQITAQSATVVLIEI